MKSYIIPAAPGTYLLDDDGAIEHAVIAWFVTEDEFGKYGEPIGPCQGSTFLLPDGKIADPEGTFDSFEECVRFRERKAKVKYRLADASGDTSDE